MKIGIFCYNLQGAGPRNRAKNLVHGLGRYTNNKVELITNTESSKLGFNYENINIHPINLKELPVREIKRVLGDTDVVHVPVNVYQALFVRSVYNGPLVLGAGTQHNKKHRILAKYLIRPSYIVETHPKVSKVWEKDGFNSTFIYPSIDVEKFKPYNKETIKEVKEGLGIPLESKVVLYVGKLNEFKGADIFYELTKMASSERKDLFFIVIGDGELSYLFPSDKQKLLPLGWVKNEDLPYYFNVADVTVVPSKSESFSFVSLESVACGTPVITTAKGTIKEIFGEDEVYLWAKRTPQDIFEKINLLLSDSKIYEEQVNKAFRFIIKNGLTLDEFVRKHIEVYKKSLI